MKKKTTKPQKKKTTKSTAVVKRESTQVAPSDAPDYVEGGQKGLDAIGQKDINIPRLKIVQSMSVEKKSGIKEGHYTNSALVNDYGTEVEFTPLFMTSGWLIFEGKGKSAKCIARKFDGDVIPPLNADLLDAESKKWNGNEPPKATQIYTYWGVVNGVDLVSFSLMKSAFKIGRKLNTLLKLKNCPAYAQTFKLGTQFVESDKGDYYIPTVEPAGWTPKPLYVKLAKQYEALSTKTFDPEVVETHEVNEVEGDDDGSVSDKF